MIPIIEDITPQEALLRELQTKGLTFASAESCTGGNIAAAMTSIPGSSAVVKGAIVAYCNEVKADLLGVSRETLRTLGAVSEPVAAQMAEGVARVIGADVAVSTTGIAGPGGATPGKPVGTVCSAVSFNGKTYTFTDHFSGDRSAVTRQSVSHVLQRALQIVGS